MMLYTSVKWVAAQIASKPATSVFSRESLVQHFYPVLHRSARTRLEVLNAAHVGRDNALGFEFRQTAELAVAQLFGELRL